MFDGVLADFGASFCKLSREMFGLPEEGFIQREWNQLGGCSETQIEAVWKRIQQTKNWWITLGKVPGTDLLKTAWRDYRIYFITSRVPTAGLPLEVQTARWIENNYGIPYPTVITETNKGPVAAALKLETYIDDKPENVESVARSIRSYGPRSYLKDAPYNQDFNWPDWLRVKDLDEFLARLENDRFTTRR